MNHNDLIGYKALEKYPKEVDVILRKVPDLKLETLNDWLCQFEAEERHYMLKLAKQINYFAEQHIVNCCQQIMVKLKKKNVKSPFFVGLGPAAKSGQMALYHFRTSNQIPTKLCGTISDVLNNRTPKSKTIVFIDDFIGTGDQASEMILKSEELQKGVVYAALVGVESGVEKFQDSTNIPVFTGEKIFSDEHIFQFGNNQAFEHVEEARKAEKIARSYGEMLKEDAPLGYGDMRLGVSFFTTLQIIRFLFFGKRLVIGSLFCRGESLMKRNIEIGFRNYKISLVRLKMHLWITKKKLKVFLVNFASHLLIRSSVVG